MTTRSDRYRFEQDESKSRVAKNQELYKKIYETDSYFQSDDKPSPIERTNEIDIEKVKELLKGREIYRREMKMRELNMIKPEQNDNVELEEKIEEKNYDINEYLDKASSEKVVEPYHKIDPEILENPKIEEPEEIEPTLEELKEMGTTELSLDMFGDFSKTTNIEEVSEEDEEDTSELVATITQTQITSDNFFTDSIKLHLEEDDEEDEEIEKSSPIVKIIMVLLVLVIIGLVVFLIFM